jgi:hypothetical protein
MQHSMTKLEAKARSKGAMHHEQDQDVQFLNSKATGKWPMSKSCQVCARNGPAYYSCKEWTICFSCRQRGHYSRHCAAQWKISKYQLAPKKTPPPFPKDNQVRNQQIHRTIWLAKNATAGGASGSKSSVLETLTDSGREALASKLSTDLSLSFVAQNPSPSSAPSLPLPSAVPQREDFSVMAFQRADPRPFSPPGF